MPKVSTNKIVLLIALVLVVVAVILLATRMGRDETKPHSSLKTHATTSTNTPTAKAPIGPITVVEPGKHFQKISAKITTQKNIQDLIAENPGKIQVIEFFNYGCFWCQRLYPVMIEWAKTKPDNVVFLQYPLIFNKPWGTLARAFYLTKELNKNNEMDMAFFAEIHQKQVDLSNEEKLKAFFASHGVSEQEFNERFHSFNVSREVNKATDIGNTYQLRLSPVVIVNAPSGSYLLTATMVGNEKNLITVLNYIIENENKKPATQ